MASLITSVTLANAAAPLAAAALDTAVDGCTPVLATIGGTFAGASGANPAG